VTIAFTPATRAASKARIALTGPSGSGKTYTALAIAHELAGPGGRIAVIDTERGRAALYAGLNGWAFDTLSPTTFSPQSLTEALGAASGAEYPVVVVDSMSHYWMGVDGMLEQADRRAKGGNSFSGWKEARPDERRMLDALAAYPGHVIITLRVKTEYVIEEDSRGKKVPRKVGMRPEQREGIEYEFDVVADLDHDNVLTVSKTRVPVLHGAVVPRPGGEFAATIRDWLADGEDVPGPLLYRSQALDADADEAGLRALYYVVRGAGLLNAPVTDEDGNPTVLGDLIVARGKRVGQVPT
jgi:DNA polymerase III delta prime subunit